MAKLRKARCASFLSRGLIKEIAAFASPSFDLGSLKLVKKIYKKILKGARLRKIRQKID